MRIEGTGYDSELVLTFSYDAAFQLAVFVFSGTTNDDDDFQAYCDAIRSLAVKLAVFAAGSTALPCAVLVVDPGNPIPDARWRKEIAEASGTLRPPMLLAVVSEASLVRGAITAINWLRPPPFEIATHSSFMRALAWLEGRRGTKLPQLTALLEEARRQVVSGRPLASSKKIPSAASR